MRGPTSPSPAITWSGAPAATRSYVLIMHDPDPCSAVPPPMACCTGPSSIFRATPKDCRKAGSAAIRPMARSSRIPALPYPPLWSPSVYGMLQFLEPDKSRAMKTGVVERGDTSAGRSQFHRAELQSPFCRNPTVFRGSTSQPSNKPPYKQSSKMQVRRFAFDTTIDASIAIRKAGTPRR